MENLSYYLVEVNGLETEVWVIFLGYRLYKVIFIFWHYKVILLDYILDFLLRFYFLT